MGTAVICFVKTLGVARDLQILYERASSSPSRLQVEEKDDEDEDGGNFIHKGIRQGRVDMKTKRFAGQTNHHQSQKSKRGN